MTLLVIYACERPTKRFIRPAGDWGWEPAIVLLEPIWEHQDEGHRFTASAPTSGQDWMSEVAAEYSQLRTAVANDTTEVTLDGITLVDAGTLRRYLEDALIPRSGSRVPAAFDVLRADFGETLTYLYLETAFGTQIGYKAVRDRELIDLPGRGIDVVGVEGDNELRLVLGEVKVSDENRTPPRVVDYNHDSLRNQLIGHVSDHESTARKLWDVARRAIDKPTQQKLLWAAFLWHEKRWDRLEVVCCAVLVRSKDRYDRQDFGKLMSDPSCVSPAAVRFGIVSLPESVDETVNQFRAAVQADGGAS